MMMKWMTLLLIFFLQEKAFADLTQQEAINRRKQVKSIAYELNFTFQKMNSNFEGLVTLDVELNDISRNLRFDLKPKELKSVLVNGEAITPTKVTAESFEIPAKLLKNKMSVVISYIGMKGSGDFISFNDTDGTEYFYTNLEPYGAHSIFPCFNQPDIKATYSLMVNAPSEWKIIANELIKDISHDKDVTIHRFHKTPPLSTYLFFVGGGHFVEWKDNHNGLPLTLYSRKSLAPYVDHQEIFNVTKKGIDYFSKYFESPMPFSKYGQIFVPSFASSGMENPGAVTLNERYIFKTEPDLYMTIKREDLIMHEIAHMWFGNLVTMKWWDDLWLNEAFASYFAALATKNAAKRESADLVVQSRKYSAYKEEQYSTYHPVMSEVQSAKTAFASFDAITYSKGAAVLNQLHKLVGDEVFKKGLVFYFKNFAFQNTTLTDFLLSFEKFYKKPISTWADSWLKTRGINTITTSFSCENGVISSFKIKLDPSKEKIRLSHKANFGFYKINQNEVTRFQVEDAVFSKETTHLPHLKGKPCPDFVFPNEEDTDYGLYYLDDRSIKNINAILAHHPDPQKRYLLWNILAMSVRNGVLSTDSYFEAVIESLKNEKERVIINLIIGTLSNSKTYSFRDTFNIFATTEQRRKYTPTIESVVFNRIINLAKDSPLRKDFYQFFALIVQSQLGQERIIQFLRKSKAGEIELAQDVRWRFITALARNGHSDALKMASEELTKDNSESGQRFFYITKTALPSLITRQEMWNHFFNMTNFSADTAYDAAEFVHTPNRPDMSEPFIQKFFDFIENIEWARDSRLANFYLTGFYPTYVCSPEALNKSKAAFHKAKKLSSRAKSKWIQLQEELQLCVLRKSEASH